MKYITTVGEQEFNIEILDERHVSVNGALYEVDFDAVSGQPVVSLLVNGKSYEAYVYEDEQVLQVLLHGRMFPVLVEDEREKRLRAASGSRIAERGDYHMRSPMPGLVIAMLVGEGQEVQKGDVLVVLESMKMQNELKSPHAGVISRLRVKPGDSVDQHQTLLTVS